jgi:hypothetical protein
MMSHVHGFGRGPIERDLREKIRRVGRPLLVIAQRDGGRLGSSVAVAGDNDEIGGAMLWQKQQRIVRARQREADQECGERGSDKNEHAAGRRSRSNPIQPIGAKAIVADPKCVVKRTQAEVQRIAVLRLRDLVLRSMAEMVQLRGPFRDPVGPLGARNQQRRGTHVDPRERSASKPVTTHARSTSGVGIIFSISG